DDNEFRHSLKKRNSRLVMATMLGHLLQACRHALRTTVYTSCGSRADPDPVIAARLPFRSWTVLLCMTAPACGQQQHPPTQLTPSEVELTQLVDDVEPVQPLDVSHGMIRLDVTVQDNSGNPVCGLRQQDVTLLDNGHPAKIVSFDAFGATAAPNPPIEVILM